MPEANRMCVLMYHRVALPKNAWEQRMAVTPTRFLAHMHALKRRGYHAVSIDQFWRWYTRQDSLPEKSFLLTFDDGYLDVYQNAAPVLKELDWPATVFLVSSRLGQQDDWCADENATRYPLMNPTQVQELMRQGFTFHSHSRTHADLPQLDDTALRDQLAGAKQELENTLGNDVAFLAYPYGRHDERVVGAAKAAGYRGSFSVLSGFNRPEEDRFRIRRLDIDDHHSEARLLRRMAFGNDGRLLGSLHYYLRSARRRLGLR